MQKYSYQFFQETPFQSVFGRPFDVVIFGAGYAGFAAALAARAAGHEVLLVDAGGDLLWETSRAFSSSTGESDAHPWRDWTTHLRLHKALQNEVVIGGMAEVLATRRLLESGVNALYYATPVALETVGDRLESVVIATQSGLRRIWAAHWIDATETGLLHRLEGVRAIRGPSSLELCLALHRTEWGGFDEPFETHASATSCWRNGAFSHERMLVVRVSEDPVEQREDPLFAALESLEQAWGEEVRQTHLSRASFLPFPIYAAGTDPKFSAPLEGLHIASPGFTSAPVETLAQRFDTGLATASALPSPGKIRKPLVDPNKPIPNPAAFFEETADVVVAGLGTGGAMAAIAAGRQGAKVAAVDPLPIAGGIGTAGGIHKYHMGFTGGLQDEIDHETMALRKRFGKIFQTGSFSPWAKQIVLRRKLKEAGVTCHHGSRLFQVQREGAAIKHSLAAGPEGVLRLKAHSWVDSTADGVLISLAGGKTWFGREGDRQPQCFSQSAGLLRKVSELLPRTNTTNIDSGWCDAVDPEDLTRARLEGIDQYLLAIEEGQQVVYIAPALGLRQGPMVVTDYTVTMADIVFPRHFDDCLAWFCCEQDTHNHDAYFEDEDTFFWCWVIGKPGRLAGEIPYRSLLPQGLSNVWVGSRAFGVAQGVQYAARQMHDIQRIGEAAGLAAALAASKQTDARSVPMDELKELLAASGASQLMEDLELRRLGTSPSYDLLRERPRPDMSAALRCLEQGEQDRPLWIFRHLDDEKRRLLREHLQAAPAGSESRWVCAAVAGFHGLPEAEAPLLDIVRNAADHYWNLPRALGILRYCASLTCLDELEPFTADPAHLTMDLRILVAQMLEALAKRHSPLPTEERLRMTAILDRLRERPIPGAIHANKYGLAPNANAVLLQGPSGFSQKNRKNRDMVSAVDDNSWKLDFAVAQALHLLNPKTAERLAQNYQCDPRVIVRRAFYKTST